jgi:FlaG/FlaF family flagellin (archaellin)
MAKFCQVCGGSVTNDNAPFCDKCGAKLPSNQPDNIAAPQQAATEIKKESKTNTYLKYGAICCGGIILCMVIAAFVFGMSGNTATNSPSVQTVSTNAASNSRTTSYTQITQTAQSGVPTSVELAIGGTATNPERQVTVFSAQKKPSYTWVGSSSSYTFTEKAKAGNTFIIIDAEVKNIGSDRMYASSGDFSVSDSEGNRYDPVMYVGDDSLGYFKELYKSQKVRGKVVFEVPLNASNLVLYYDFGNLFSGTKLASWKIN